MTSVLNNFYASATDSGSTQSSDRLASDKFTFLKLLVAQLTNQDPLDPTDDKEFLSQLAQFSSLEQLQEISTGVESLNGTMHQGQLMTATSFIGKAVVVSGSQITKTNDANGDIVASYVYYTADEAFEKAYVTITDGTNIISTDTIDGKQAGAYVYEWNGKNNNGKEAATGVYEIIIAAVDANDKSVLVNTQFSAQVNSVFTEDGVYCLSLTGGRTVALTDVVEVGEAATTTTTVDPTTYSGLAADHAATASLAADSAASHEASIDGETTSEEAKNAAVKAADAAATAQKAAKEAEKIADEAYETAQKAQTADALKDYNEAREWADKAGAYAAAADVSADQAKAKALAIDPALDM